MFNFLKSKPILKELIPKGFIDIHSHILPGIDDGAKNVKESLKLVMQMRELGFSKLIATPHTYPGLFNNTSKTIKDSYLQLKKKSKYVENVFYASEYMVDLSLVKKAEEKSLLTLKKNYVLIEMSYFSAVNNLYEIIFQLRMNDYIPILAHPERYVFLHNNKEITKIKNAGCKLQVNLLSSIGYYGVEVSKQTDYLLTNNLVDFVGSDIHNQSHISAFSKKIIIKNIRKLTEVIEKNIEFN